MAEIFKQLGDTTRVRIFWLLCHCEECVINISAMMEMSSPAVSHHLRPLQKPRAHREPPGGQGGLLQGGGHRTDRLLHQMIEQVMEISCPDR